MVTAAGRGLHPAGQPTRRLGTNRLLRGEPVTDLAQLRRWAVDSIASITFTCCGKLYSGRTSFWIDPPLGPVFQPSRLATCVLACRCICRCGCDRASRSSAVATMTTTNPLPNSQQLSRNKTQIRSKLPFRNKNSRNNRPLLSNRLSRSNNRLLRRKSSRRWSLRRPAARCASLPWAAAAAPSIRAISVRGSPITPWLPRSTSSLSTDRTVSSLASQKA